MTERYQLALSSLPTEDEEVDDASPDAGRGGGGWARVLAALGLGCSPAAEEAGRRRRRRTPARPPEIVEGDGRDEAGGEGGLEAGDGEERVPAVG
eukprot:CAMPEP_0197414370 /NCGR_PEP_ID=MMETSP1170-20131217/1097_1 /TAXON_ID=54406 /ORGANISM="Sarcinochrysis sp, Strain CCMP770" /LENGTH=94 /DNA_ID=CAMNT_0042941077 /DNA_START=42 /DNA_END=323 /DNA_ORIENTATION=-